MTEEVRPPVAAHLPSLRQLNRATAIAAGVAAVLLATVILPAEYGVDPTGVGRVLGLTEMGETKREAAAAAAAEESSVEEGVAANDGDILMEEQEAAPSGPARNGEVQLTLQPGEGTEVKATMQPGDEIRYSWSTGGPRVNFELHGEEIGASGSDYTSYEKGTSAGESGTFRAPFAGTHGWFWRNRTAAPVTITVRAEGIFSKFEQIGDSGG